MPSRREALLEVSRPVERVHGRAKHISPEKVTKALDNEPFEDFVRADYAWKRMRDEGGEAKDRFNQSYRKAVESFLRRIYHVLTFIPEISFNIEKISEDKERSAIKAAGKSLDAAHVSSQAGELEEAYTGLCALRTVFANSGRHEDFTIETVISRRYLPELFIIAPVRFFTETEKYPDQSTIRYFCDLCPTEQFAWIFQRYNESPRWFGHLEGRDVMPLPIAELAGRVMNLFDYLVITTPYHDLASKEWKAKREWTPNIDPFLFGFLKQVPEYIFFLGRWSGTGLFPLMGDMIADTIDHIRQNQKALVDYEKTRGWYRDVRKPRRFYDLLFLDENTKVVNKLLGNFERGSLFSWLRGESK